MFTILRRILSTPVQIPAEIPVDPEHVEAGARVRRRSDGEEGILCAYLTWEGELLARVVFVGHRASRVAILPASELEALERFAA